MQKNYFVNGQWNVICDVCGFKKKSGEVRKRWDGLMVCQEDFEMRHPLDFIRVPTEQNNLQDSRPEGADQFINVCLIWEIAAYADLGSADCMAADKATPSYQFLVDLKNTEIIP